MAISIYSPVKYSKSNAEAKLRGLRSFARAAVSFSGLLGGPLDTLISVLVKPDPGSLG
jgi:hypothetical protein